MAMTMDGRDAAVWGSPVKRAWWAAADEADAGEAWRTAAASPQRAAKMPRTEAPPPSRKHARDEDEDEDEGADAQHAGAGPSWWCPPATTFVAAADGYTVALDENRNQNGRPEAHVAAGQPRKQRRTEAPVPAAGPDVAAMHTMSLVPHVPLLPPAIGTATVVPLDDDGDNDGDDDPAAHRWRVPATVVLHPAYSGVPHLVGFGRTLPYVPACPAP